jgi:protein AbiQ
VFLTQDFYSDHAHCPEILLKDDRPHIQIQVKVNNQLFCIPLRSNISHQHVLWTDRANKCGLDFSKAVIIIDSQKYIDNLRQPIIRQNEFDTLRGKEHIIETSLMKYVTKYKDAKNNLHISRNSLLVKCSTLQYFEKYI